ncbi:MAG TPA: aminotransferase class I/II-fold pyridoxal phosphate-dependent enzyme, partial [Candidatus Moranbacteria bacterium]|nr:aminotransferase class I/II-fold pyridoxal phosphate-dependent enzyme [Candidatus Moranbacteria bacterium]
MRTDIVHSGADELVYEIRGVAAAAEVIAREGKRVIWENIGDPIAKGHRVPEWIKDLVAAKLRQDRVFGYSPTRGLDRTREFIVEQRRREGGAALSKDDILFFNGLGDAISIIYTYLNPAARVIGPSPAYPTHSSAEASHGNSPHITYSLNPDRDWLPDMENLRNHIKYNPTIAGILIINPDNPTGMVYPREILKQMVDLAREFDLFLISD